MTQIATVERILDADHAEISVPRKSACGHDCEECAGCGVSGAAVKARAANPIGARPGQKVVVESSTKKMLRIVALVYLIPVVLFLAGYCRRPGAASVGVQYAAAGPASSWASCSPSSMTGGCGPGGAVLHHRAAVLSRVRLCAAASGGAAPGGGGPVPPDLLRPVPHPGARGTARRPG